MADYIRFGEISVLAVFEKPRVCGEFETLTWDMPIACSLEEPIALESTASLSTPCGGHPIPYCVVACFCSTPPMRRPTRILAEFAQIFIYGQKSSILRRVA